MNKNMPRTPLSTPLSGSAREAEIRIRNIFSAPKRQPPRRFLALMCLLVLSCGNLVSCQVAEVEQNVRQGGTSFSDPVPVGRGVPADLEHPPQSEQEEWLLQALFQAADQAEPFQSPTAQLINFIRQGDHILGVAFVKDHLENTLILGVMDQETKELIGPLFRYAVKGGVPNTATFQDDEGRDCLLYTFNGQMMGQYRGQAGAVRLDGTDITWEWPVEGDIRDPGSTLQKEYEDYCLGHLALMAPGGVDIYEANPEFEWGQEEPQSMWQLSTGELFYADSSSAAALPMPIYFQTLRWLAEATGDPGGWRITALTADEERSDPERLLDCYTLQAREELGDETLTADLFFSYDAQPGRWRSYDHLDHAEVYEVYDGTPGVKTAF